jgi:hypothetical protein
VTWLYNGQPLEQLPLDTVGFVYLITNNITGRMYIGKKLGMRSKINYKTVTQKNGVKKKKKIKSKVESDWKDYWSSSDLLKQDIAELGQENFTREILYFCKSKAECSYLEAKTQFQRGVLESTNYYNNNIQVRVHGSHILKKSEKNG